MAREAEQTILVVEDESGVYRVLSRILSKKGYVTTVRAEDGEEAVALAREIAPDLVILDLNLPDYDGIQVLSKLKALDEGIRVIILTGHGSPETVRSAMEIGAIDFLTKPFSLRELCAVVGDALKSRLPAEEDYLGRREHGDRCCGE